MIHTLNNLPTAKSNGSKETAKDVLYFLNYYASNPNPSKMYTASDMILSVQRNTAYLVASKVHSRIVASSSLVTPTICLSTAPLQSSPKSSRMSWHLPPKLKLQSLSSMQESSFLFTSLSLHTYLHRQHHKQKKTKATDM